MTRFTPRGEPSNAIGAHVRLPVWNEGGERIGELDVPIVAFGADAAALVECSVGASCGTASRDALGAPVVRGGDPPRGPDSPADPTTPSPA